MTYFIEQDAEMKRIFPILLILGVLLLAVNSWAVEGTVKGRLVTYDGKPLSDGQIFFFAANSELHKPMAGKFWRVPDSVMVLDGKGRFTTQLEEGVYYLGAIKRNTPNTLGPPRTGDYYMPSRDKRGKYHQVKVIANSLTDIGTIRGITRYNSKTQQYKGKRTAIEGKLETADGAPVQGLSVFAYLDPSMKGRPQFVSEESGIDGRYLLAVDTARTLYLKARGGYSGGTPKAGSMVGVYLDGDMPAPVVTKNGEITKNINIMIEAFAGTGKQENK